MTLALPVRRVGLVAAVVVLAAVSWSPATGVESVRSEGRAASSVPSVGPTETVSDHRRDAKGTTRIAVGWGGRVTAVWYRHPPTDSGSGGRLFASVRRRDGVWSALVPISSRNQGARTVDVAAGRGGQVSVVWVARRNGRRLVVETHREQGEWTTPQRLGRGIRPKVVVDGDRQTSVMWFGRRMQVASRDASGDWVRRIFVRGGTPISYDLATNRAGDEVAIWNAVTVSRSRHSAAWSDVETLPFVMANNEYDPALGVFPDGRALATWNYAEEVFWARRSPWGRWRRPNEFVRTPGEIEQGGSMATAVTRTGHALIQWNASYGGTVVSRYRPGEGFGRPIRLTKGTGYFVAAYRAVLLAPDGAALVAGEDRHVGAYRWQKGPGRPWRPVRKLGAPSGLSWVDARGTRMAVLFHDDTGLRARIIDLVPAT